MVVNGGRDIQVTMEARTVGWLALGFSEMPKMKGADMIGASLLCQVSCLPFDANPLLGISGMGGQ